MKPLRLVMSAFGPYAGEEVIEFEKLGNTGLYLITGDTGSGKTTVFDAISFALFGESSGGNREPSMLRSRFAEPKTKTFVELEFLYKNNTYRVKRNPEYLRPKDRGEGETKERADAQFYLPGDGLITGIKNVDDKITELLGVNKEQFSQIAMIAQGDFLKLLLADTKKRSEIFREIFGTKNYQELQDALRSRSGKLHDEYDRISASIGQYLEGIRCPEEHPYYEEMERFKSDKKYASAKAQMAGKLLEELCDDLQIQVKEYEKAFQEADKAFNKVNHKLGIFQSVKQGEDALEKAEKKLAELRDKSEESSLLFNKEEEKAPGRKALSEEITIKKEKLKDFDELDELTAEYGKSEKQLKELSRSIGKEEKEIEQLQDQIVKGQEKRALLDNPLAKYSRLEQEKERLEQFYLIFKEYEEDLKRIQELGSKQKQEKEKYQKAAEDADKKLTFSLKLERAFLDGQAGVLAAGLKTGEPCPVCGSLEHPSPAFCREEVPEQSEVEEAKELAEACRQEAVRLSEKANEISGQRTVLEEKSKDCGEKLLKAWKELPGMPFEIHSAADFQNKEAFRDSGSRVKDRIFRVQEEMEKTALHIEEAKELDQKLPRMNQELMEKKSQFQDHKEQSVKLQQAMESLQFQKEKLKTQLGFGSKKEAVAYVKGLEKELAQMEKDYEKAKKETEDINGKLKETEAAIKTLTDSVKKQKKEAGEEDMEVLRAKEKRLKQEREQISEARKEAELMADADERVKRNVLKQLDRLSETGEKWQMVKALHNTASGSIAGKDKIMLETYVQMAYFDRIINRANVHFMKMTDGRFELLRCQEAGNQKSQSGLELNVLDHYYMSKNGGSRSVKSLSGGESFLAALSLALGMSEEVSANAGGIEMDAMFVDEGFGSLDEGALDRAIRALQELSTANRIVGIISHVPELKNRMDRQIVVKRDKLKGSRTELVL
ncbi:MAG: SMC family ATPase [Lachnospiraceae bacterium]|nr:SMC family ATPase [Lachnospiraceae bacterium]